MMFESIKYINAVEQNMHYSKHYNNEYETHIRNYAVNNAAKILECCMNSYVL